MNHLLYGGGGANGHPHFDIKHLCRLMTNLKPILVETILAILKTGVKFTAGNI